MKYSIAKRKLCVISCNFKEVPFLNKVEIIKLHLTPSVCSFSSILCKILVSDQILWSLCSVDFHTLTLQLPIQTLHYVAPDLQVFVSSLENCQNFSKTSTLLRTPSLGVVSDSYFIIIPHHKPWGHTQTNCPKYKHYLILFYYSPVLLLLG